jgi:ribosome-associated protein
MEEIRIRTDFIRLDALLKYAGLTGTGGEAKSVIQEGMVQVNGEECRSRGKKIMAGDEVRFAGVAIKVTGGSAEEQ